jgi:hypothetical protein
MVHVGQILDPKMQVRYNQTLPWSRIVGGCLNACVPLIDSTCHDTYVFLHERSSSMHVPPFTLFTFCGLSLIHSSETVKQDVRDHGTRLVHCCCCSSRKNSALKGLWLVSPWTPNRGGWGFQTRLD